MKINFSKKAFFILTVLTISYSCEKDTLEEQTVSYDLELSFETQNSQSSTNSKNKSQAQVEQFGATIIIEGDNMDIISDSLEISTAINSETGAESYVIHLKNNSEQNSSSKSSGTGPSVEWGYFYDGDDCWIYGTWYHGDNGQSLFVPASATSQFLNNVCGWSNVA